MIELCKASELAEGETREFTLKKERIFILRWESEVYAYTNSCPHAGWPLNFQPSTFFNLEKTHIQCSNHMAIFEPATGNCVSGPCTGDKLSRLSLQIIDGMLCIDQ